MLTPQDINGKEFEKAVFGGYDMSSVDEFLESVAEDYSSLYKDNAVLKGKLKVLVEKVEEYRSTEDSMRMALLTAQKMGDEMIEKAKQQSSEMLENAEKSVKLKLQECEKQIRDENARLAAAKRETALFAEKAKDAIRKYSGFLGRLDEITAVEEKKPAPPAPTREEEIVDTARAIDSAVTKIVQDDPGQPLSGYNKTVAPIEQQIAQQQLKAAAKKQAAQETEPQLPDRPSGHPRTVVRAPEQQTPSFAVSEEEHKQTDNQNAGVPADDISRQIQDAVSAKVQEEMKNATAEEAAASDKHGKKYDDEAEPTKLFRMKTPSSTWDDEDEPTSPRPKFSFDNLRFGSNYTGSDQ